jgi:hypothetical protein
VRPAAGLALLLALILAGCENNLERSAEVARLARQRPPAQRGLSITRASADVKVTGTTVLRGAEGAAVVVSLRNTSARALRNVPIAITVSDAHGKILFQNNAPGLEAALTSLAWLPAHGEAQWIDDQVPGSGAPASASAIAGAAPNVSGSIPQVEVGGVHTEAGSAEGASAAGTAHNRSGVLQRELVVYVLARRAGRIVAAGRAVLPEVAAGASAPFQAFLVGSPAGARLQASAPPTTFG